jgi:hypothetical protein
MTGGYWLAMVIQDLTVLESDRLYPGLMSRGIGKPVVSGEQWDPAWAGCPQCAVPGRAQAWW